MSFGIRLIKDKLTNYRRDGKAKVIVMQMGRLALRGNWEQLAMSVCCSACDQKVLNLSLQHLLGETITILLALKGIYGSSSTMRII